MSGTQDPAPDFVLMRLVSEYEEDHQHHIHHQHQDHYQHLHLQHQHQHRSRGSEPEAQAQSGGQLMFLQNLLVPGENPVLPVLGTPGSGDAFQNLSAPEPPSRRFEWSSMFRLPKEVCHKHRLISDAADWTRLGGNAVPKSTSVIAVTPAELQDPVLTLAKRLGELGELRELEDLQKKRDVPICTCEVSRPGEDPSETSDALLVLQGPGAQEIEPGPRQGSKDEGSLSQEDRLQQNEAPADPQLYSSSLSRLMDQVHRLTREACREPPGLEPDRTERNQSLPVQGKEKEEEEEAVVPRSRPPTPKRVVGSPLVFTPHSRERKSRRGAFRVCLSKLFRTRSSSSVGKTPEKRPSLTSSTSSVWSSSSTDPESSSVSKSVLGRPRSVDSPVPFTDDFRLPQTGRLSSGTASTQTITHTHRTIQHSLSLNDASLHSVQRPCPLQPDRQSAVAVDQRHLLFPLSQPDSCNFATSLRELEKCGWYWGPMNWEDAEMKLKGKADGSFLVRDSSDPRYILSLSFRSQGVTHHTRMEHYRGTFSLWCHPRFEDRCHSVVEFIERAVMHSQHGRFLYFLRSRVPGVPPTPVQLLYPVSRFSSVKSLQHLCRFCIRQLVRIDHIQELPLPPPLIVYLRKFYFYDPEEEKALSVNQSGWGSRGQEAESQT
ncbi:suppressor of cytokine signaling 7-like isoform X2 [Hoplias malabaricus]|uniref:suppressor of cytokine signaling 7-like isoform X2 n=1 Tax=Hoplias malabaricus TaxID=27720 RepID=UPI003462CEF0